MTWAAMELAQALHMGLARVHRGAHGGDVALE